MGDRQGGNDPVHTAEELPGGQGQLVADNGHLSRVDELRMSLPPQAGEELPTADPFADDQGTEKTVNPYKMSSKCGGRIIPSLPCPVACV